MRDVREVRIVVNELGCGKCFLGDEDISDCVQAIVIRAQAGNLSKIELHVIGKVNFEGPGEITTIADSIKVLAKPDRHP